MSLPARSIWCPTCDEVRRECRCLEIAAEARIENRTARLLRAIDLIEGQIGIIEIEDESHKALPELREKLNNLTRALVNHRKVA